jgi:type III restriction enzyme
MYYRLGADHLEYQPDFVGETGDCIYMLEAKARNDMQDAEVQVKKDAAVQWCSHATSHALSHGGKPWKYLLIPHDAISENMTLLGLANQCRVD